MLPLVTAVVAQLFDFATFVAMVHRDGPRAEANPLVAALFVDYGTPGVALAKASLLLFVVALAVWSASRPRRVWLMAGVLPVAFAIVAGLIGGISNASVILG